MLCTQTTRRNPVYYIFTCLTPSIDLLINKNITLFLFKAQTNVTYFLLYTEWLQLKCRYSRRSSAGCNQRITLKFGEYADETMRNQVTLKKY